MRKLIIGVSPELVDTAEVKALSERTCDVRVVEGLGEYDIIFGPKCWYMPLTHLRYLAVALKSTRKTVKGAK
jgi:hypothetical protein